MVTPITINVNIGASPLSMQSTPRRNYVRAKRGNHFTDGGWMQKKRRIFRDTGGGKYFD